MKIFHNLIVFLFLFISVFSLFGINEAFASNYLTQINKDSNQQKVKKLQNIFLELGLYNGKIDGKFESIKDELIKYQVENNIISHSNHDEAGYFGNKTIKSLEEKYSKEFLELKEKYLKLEELETNKEGYFTVTAYYTPVRGQYKYQRGSYEADIRLNGKGITASGKKPFAGALALPRNYKFGTKIYLDGVGVGVVEDRGGAIVNSGEKGQIHDRIDIWVGYGDEGRERAINWGKRKVKGYIANPDREITIEFDRSKLPNYRGLKIDLENPKKENVVKLQELFKEIGLYNGEIDGKYEDIKDKLISYQKQKGITSHLGYFGTKTYRYLEKDYGNTNGNGLFKEKYDDKKEKVKESIGDGLTQKDKNNINLVKSKLIKIFKKQTNTEQELEKTISEFKDKLTKMIPKMRQEKQKLIIKYLVESF